MAVVFKLIKPQRLKEGDFRLKMLNAARKAGTQIKGDFEKCVATWDHKPKFAVEVSLTGPGPIVEVWTDDKVFRYVNEGTKEHDVWAGYYTGKSDKKVLVFQEHYKEKTSVGVIGSTAGGPSGKLIFRPYVHVEGIEARKFDKAIAKVRQPWFKREMEQAMREWAAQSGYKL